MVSSREIKEITGRIVQEFHPQRVVLFGSYADGKAGRDSDVDLLVVLPFRGKPFRKSLEILDHLNVPFPLDVVVRRPAEVKRRYAEGDPLVREAIDRGRVLYERNG